VGGPSSSDPSNGSPPILFRIVSKSNQSIATCPSCQAKDLRRLHWTLWEKAIYRGVYKCSSCGRSRCVGRLIVPSAWMESKLLSVYHFCLRHARLWRVSTLDPNAQPIPRSSRWVELLREVILDLETQLTPLRARAQRGVNADSGLFVYFPANSDRAADGRVGFVVPKTEYPARRRGRPAGSRKI